MPHPVDIYVGKRLRNRRWLAGQTQQQLASEVGIKFQQIQKYESGANRISASRLYELARALEVPVSYFFEGYEETASAQEEVVESGAHPANGESQLEHNVMSARETMDLVRAYYQMEETPRRRFLDLAKALNGIENNAHFS